MMCARFLRHETGEHNRLYRFSETPSIACYAPTMFPFAGFFATSFSFCWSLSARFALNIYLFVQTPKASSRT